MPGQLLVKAPALLELARALPERYPFLLASTSRDGRLGRYDILPAMPDQWLESSGKDDFLPRLDTARQRRRVDLPPSRLPFLQGWFVYLGYELSAEVEPVLPLRPVPDPLPVALAVYCRGSVVLDHRSGQAWAWAENAELLREIVADCRRIGPSDNESLPAATSLREEPPEHYRQGIARIHEYILAGDVFQVNLSRKWTLRYASPPDPACLFRRMARLNPAPFAAWMQWRGVSVVSASPERLLRHRDGRLDTRPIAGTRPRGNDAAEDAALRAELMAHPKERAEHVMLVDLERNDLGRIAIPGTVEVDEMMVTEHYATVQHIVSNVTAQVRPECTHGEMIRAVFPGGTITGCPKVRCMQIIQELEPEGRGAYTGSLGYIDDRGHMDLNILIRTLVVNGRELHFRAGGGIVIDSARQAEVDETRAKALGLLRSLESAAR